MATTGSVGATVRQSEIGLEVYDPTLAGAQASANVNLDFMGGFSNVSNGVTDNLVRLRTATLRLDWTQTSLAAGQDTPFFLATFSYFLCLAWLSRLGRGG